MTFDQNITHRVSLWLDNEEYSYNLMLEIAKYNDLDIRGTANDIQAYVVDLTEDMGMSGMVEEIFTTAIAYIDFEGMAKAYIETVRENQE